MRIALVVHYFAPHVGGMEEVVKKQAESLVAAGHQVTVFTCRPGAGVPLRETMGGYEIRRLRALNFIERKFGVTFPLVSPLTFLRFLREFRGYDAVHIHDVFYMTSHAAAFAAWLWRMPVYVTQHVAMVDHPSRLVMVVQQLVYGVFGRRIFAQARRIVCYNTNVRDFLLGFRVPERKILLNYNGVDVAYFSPVDAAQKLALRQKYDLPVDKPVVLFVGRLVPKKGFDIVYAAHDPAWTTLLVGGGHDAAELPEKPGLVFFGTATHERLRDLYRLSDVFVFPAIGEMLTLVMQEAMASGLPVITTNDPAYGQYQLDDTKLHFVERTPQAVGQAIRDVLADEKAHAVKSAYVRQIALARFSWQANYPQELAIYDQEAA